MFGNKVNGAFKSFGVSCDGNGGKWLVLGPGSAGVPNKLHSSWSDNIVTSLTVYKWYDPKLKYFVVTNVNICSQNSATNTNSCHGFNSLPACTKASKTCLVEETVAAEGESLTNWYFETILDSVETPETPGSLLQLKASVSPFA